jgi:hypothetical protein
MQGACQGGALGQHNEVGDLLEAHRGGGLTSEVVSTGVQLGRRGTVVRGGVRWWWLTARGSGRWSGHGVALMELEDNW